MRIGKATNKAGKKVFVKFLPSGDRMEIKKTKDGWKEVGLLPKLTDEEKQIKRLGMRIKAAEIRGDDEKKKQLEDELAELTK